MEYPNEKLPALKSLFILETLAKRGSYLGINEISALTGLSQSTVHRVLGEMVHIGFVEKNEKYKKYRVGMRAAILASHFMQSNNVVSFSREEMLRLNTLTGETIHLLAISDNSVIYLNKINTSHTLGLMSYIGKINPLHCTAGGKCIAAFMDEGWVERYLASSNRMRYTENTLTTPDELRREFELIRQQGYALDRSEHHRDVNCVSAPIFDQTGRPVAAISISAPSYRFPLEKAIELAQEVMASCQVVSQMMGSDI